MCANVSHGRSQLFRKGGGGGGPDRARGRHLTAANQRRRNVFKSGGAEVNLIKWAWSFMCHDVILRHGPLD